MTGFRAAVLLAQGRTEGVAELSIEMADAARSFVAIAFAIVPLIALRLLAWTSGETGIPENASRLLAHDTLVMVVSWLGFIILSHRLAVRLGREALWPRFVVTYNWCNVVANIMVLAGGLPAVLGAPPMADQVAGLVVTGWGLWLEWYAIRVTLRTGPLLALYFVLVDLAISVGFAVAGAGLGPR